MHDPGERAPGAEVVDACDGGVPVILSARPEPRDGRLHWLSVGCRGQPIVKPTRRTSAGAIST